MSGLDRVYAVLGGLLLLTLLLPAEDGLSRPVFVWQLFGVTSFATLARALYPGVLGVVLMFLAWSHEGRAVKGIVGIVGFLLPVVVLGIGPIKRLAYLGAWETATGHQLLLYAGIVGAAAGCRHVAVGAARVAGALFATIGVALLLAYLLAPLPDRSVPLIRRFAEVSATWWEGGFALLSAIYGLLVSLAVVVVCALVLVAIRADRHGQVNRDAAVVAGWATMGALPAFALPLCVKAGLAASDTAAMLLLGRYLTLLVVVLTGLPFALTALTQAATGNSVDLASDHG